MATARTKTAHRQAAREAANRLAEKIQDYLSLRIYTTRETEDCAREAGLRPKMAFLLESDPSLRDVFVAAEFNEPIYLD